MAGFVTALHKNGGRTLPHKDVVRALQPLGSWRGEALTLDLPLAADPAYRTAILLQQGKGGPIIAASRM